MDAVINEVLAVVRAGGNAKAAFAALRDIVVRHMPGRNWRAIHLPELFETDTLEVIRWIDTVAKPYGATNVMWWLDTLNERDGLGKNFTTGMTNRVPPDAELNGWSIALEGPRESHLMWGLMELHKKYAKWNAEFQVSEQVNYVLFLGYSGLVFASAVKRSTYRKDCRFLWGFGEGCPYPLIRTSADGALRL